MVLKKFSISFFTVFNELSSNNSVSSIIWMLKVGQIPDLRLKSWVFVTTKCISNLTYFKMFIAFVYLKARCRRVCNCAHYLSWWYLVRYIVDSSNIQSCWWCYRLDAMMVYCQRSLRTAFKLPKVLMLASKVGLWNRDGKPF